jgi:hypothetical protein
MCSADPVHAAKQVRRSSVPDQQKLKKSLLGVIRQVLLRDPGKRIAMVVDQMQYAVLIVRSYRASVTQTYGKRLQKDT